jgi:hypothetical protein
VKPAAEDGAIGDWIEGRIRDDELASALEDRDDELAVLLRAGLATRPSLTALETEQAWKRLAAALPQRRSSFRTAWWLPAAASLVAAVGAVATLAPRRESPRPSRYVLLREVGFESRDHNRTVSFKLQIYRTTEAENERTLPR